MNTKEEIQHNICVILFTSYPERRDAVKVSEKIMKSIEPLIDKIQQEAEREIILKIRDEYQPFDTKERELIRDYLYKLLTERTLKSATKEDRKTHWACPEMVKKYGGEVKCCDCNKHNCKKEDAKEEAAG